MRTGQDSVPCTQRDAPFALVARVPYDRGADRIGASHLETLDHQVGAGPSLVVEQGGELLLREVLELLQNEGVDGCDVGS